ncbi:MAG: sterol desaturase family protein [Stappiaceae bacterium]
MSILERLSNELGKPRDQRRLGSGWLSGSGALLAGLTGFLLVLALRYPGTFVTPDLMAIHDTGFLRPFVHIVLLTGYALALISLLLSKDKVLGGTAFALVLAASLMGGSHTAASDANPTSLYFGLDFFVLNVLFIGFLFVPLERFFPHRADQTVFRPEWQEDMFYYLVSSMLVQILTFLTMAPSNFINSTLDLNNIQTQIMALPFIVQVIIIMVATDFVQYWFHRLFHQVPFLWKFHAVHHSAQSMDWLAGARMHFIEIALLRGMTAVPMFTLGFDPAAIQVYILIVYFYSSLVHANLRWNLGGLEKYLVTPRFHHWHHGKEKEAIDVNFAIHFPLYDRLFGTYHMPKGKWPSAYGIGGDPVPSGYLKQFLYPFKKAP